MEREKKKNIIFFGNHSTILKSKRVVGRQGAGKKVEMFIQMSVLNTLHISPLFFGTLSFSRH